MSQSAVPEKRTTNGHGAYMLRRPSDTACLPVMTDTNPTSQYLPGGTQNPHYVPQSGSRVHAYIFQKCRNHLKMLSACRVTCTCSKLQTECPQVLGATVQNLVATAALPLGFVSLWSEQLVSGLRSDTGTSQIRIRVNSHRTTTSSPPPLYRRPTCTQK